MQLTSLLSAVILVGGKSSRMGYPKYLAKIGAKTILRRQLDVLSGIFGEIILVTNQAQSFRDRPGVTVVADLVDNQGPVGGLFTGLNAASGPGVLLIACDLPFLEDELIRELIKGFECQRFDGRIPISSRGLEPLHAVYSKHILKTIEVSIGSGSLSMRRLIESSNCETVDWRCRQTNTFMNINTPDELELIKPVVLPAP